MTGDFIKIMNLKVFAHHGVFPEETRDGQDFYVNAKLFLDCRKAGKTDNLSDSLNYGEVSHFITDFLQDHTYKLIESVAEQLAEAMLLSMPVLKGVEIELCKPHAPIGLPFENVSVTMKRQWHEVYLAVGSNLGQECLYWEWNRRTAPDQRDQRGKSVRTSGDKALRRSGAGRFC